jgi:hypothetical protein
MSPSSPESRSPEEIQQELIDIKNRAAEILKEKKITNVQVAVVQALKEAGSINPTGDMRVLKVMQILREERTSQ